MGSNLPLAFVNKKSTPFFQMIHPTVSRPVFSSSKRYFTHTENEKQRLQRLCLRIAANQAIDDGFEFSSVAASVATRSNNLARAGSKTVLVADEWVFSQCLP